MCSKIRGVFRYQSISGSSGYMLESDSIGYGIREDLLTKALGADAAPVLSDYCLGRGVHHVKRGDDPTTRGNIFLRFHRRCVAPGALVNVLQCTVILIALALANNAKSQSLEANSKQSSDRASGVLLPFDRPGAAPQVEKPTTARELWSLSGLKEEDWASFDDRQGLIELERELLLRLLDRLRQFERGELEAFAVEDAKGLWNSPEKFRGQIVRISGKASSLKQIDLTESEKSRFSLGEYFQVEIQCDELGSVTLFVPQVPRSWLPVAHLDEPVQAVAVILEARKDPDRWLAVASPWLEWYPVEARQELGLFPSHVQLAQLGFDIAWLDILRQANGQPMSRVEKDPFYALLTATRRNVSNQPHAARHLDLPALLRAPGNSHGALFAFTASVRRATRIVVDDPVVQERYGVSHYYELDVLIPLGNVTIQLKDSDPQKRLIYENNYPATVCSLRVPDQIERAARNAAAGITESPLINETLQVEGYFYRIWGYSSEYVSSRAPGSVHPSPLFIATEVKLRPATVPPRDYWLSATVAVVFAAGMLLILYLAWKWK